MIQLHGYKRKKSENFYWKDALKVFREIISNGRLREFLGIRTELADIAKESNGKNLQEILNRRIGTIKNLDIYYRLLNCIPLNKDGTFVSGTRKFLQGSHRRSNDKRGKTDCTVVFFHLLEGIGCIGFIERGPVGGNSPALQHVLSHLLSNAY